MTDTKHESKTKLLNATLVVVRIKGYAATRVEDICETAGLTKGSFFHHFSSKEELAIAAVEHWSEMTGGVFISASYHALPDPLDRLLGYINFRKELLRGEVPDFTCLVGTMVQEVYETHPHLRAACEKSISDHAATLEPTIAKAMKKYGIKDKKWSARSLALHTQTVIQGAFVLAKAMGGTEVAAESLDHLRRYVKMLFNKTN